MQQISIFELLDERRIEDMSVLEIAQEIAGRFGKEATKSRFEGYYEFKTGKCRIVIGKNRYYPEVHGGAWYISVDLQYKDGGYACPCDSFEEVPGDLGSDERIGDSDEEGQGVHGFNGAEHSEEREGV